MRTSISTFCTVIAVIGTITTGCSRKDDIRTEPETVTKVFSASFENATKTSLVSDSVVNWVPDDTIRYYADKPLNKLQKFAIKEGGTSTEIETKFEPDASFLVAVYGGTDVIGFSGGGFSLQGAVTGFQSGKFSDAHVSVAKVNNPLHVSELKFYNMTSLIKFSVDRYYYGFAVFKTGDRSELHEFGKIPVKFNGTTPSAYFDDSTTGCDSVIVLIQKDAPTYIATLPRAPKYSHVKGFTIDLYDTNGYCRGQVKSDSVLRLMPDGIVDLGAIDGRRQNIPVDYAYLDVMQAVVKPNTTFTLKATILPSNAKVEVMNWRSSDTAVAVVSPSGEVTTKKEGLCEISLILNNSYTVSCELYVSNAEEHDLSIFGTANCYIVSDPGTYKFKAVKGNSQTPVGSIDTAVVLWESFEYGQLPPGAKLIDTAYVKGDTIKFTTNRSGGNAVIAAKDNSGNILWSWHIWVAKDYDIEAQSLLYYNFDVVMDRNLGASTGEKGEVGAIGLLYQWGRKDPFLGSRIIDKDEMAEYIGENWTVVDFDTTGTVGYTIEHPMTFIKNGKSPYDWMKTEDSTLWASTKTIYDPCPPGWRVPDGGKNGLWNTSYDNSGYPDFDHQKYHGIDFGSKFGFLENIWYQASGYYDDGDGKLTGTGHRGRYWSCTPCKGESYCFYFQQMMDPKLNSEGRRAQGCSVRCIKEWDYTH